MKNKEQGPGVAWKRIVVFLIMMPFALNLMIMNGASAPDAIQPSFCEPEEHVHGEACRASQGCEGEAEGVFTAHAHDATCDLAQEPICGQEERSAFVEDEIPVGGVEEEDGTEQEAGFFDYQAEIHGHSEDCYRAESPLCGLEEIPPIPEKTEEVALHNPAEEPNEPIYPVERALSPAMTGAATLHGAALFYASDGSTSQIESRFSGDARHDGKVWADQSVTYSNEEDPTRFEVTLSALSQQYEEEDGPSAQTLAEGSALRFVNPLGAHMAVFDEAMALRYQGETYPCAAYAYDDGAVRYRPPDVMVTNADGQSISLREVGITIYQEPDGAQRVEWEVPAALLPARPKSAEHSYDHEMQPIRLTYQVGVSPAHLSDGMTANTPYYVSAWESGEQAYAEFLPAAENPYYAGGTSIAVVEEKADHATETAEIALHKRWDGAAVRFEFGNNGRLLLERDAPDTLEVQVVKEWHDLDGNPLFDLVDWPGTTVTLYRKTAEQSDEIIAPVAENPAILSGENGWAHRWENLPLQGEEGIYAYYVVEQAAPGYETTYTVDGGEETTGQSMLVSGVSSTVTIHSRPTQPVAFAALNQTRAFGEITAVKHWQTVTGEPIADVSRMPSVGVTLIRAAALMPDESKNPYDHPDEVRWLAETVLETAVLGHVNGWRATWSGLPLTGVENQGIAYYFYFVEEAPIAGYRTIYSDNNTVGITSGTIEVINRALSTIVMPETGGPGRTALTTIAWCVVLGIPAALLVGSAAERRRIMRR